MKIVNWAKQNKLAAALLVIVVIVAYNFLQSLFGISLLGRTSSRSQTSFYGGGSPAGVSNLGSIAAPSREIGVSAPPETASDIALEDRKVIQNSNMSLLVTDVRGVSDKIIIFSEKSGGFMVSTSLNQPEESAYATVTVRVPTEKFNDALEYFRSLAVKVTNENLQGTDVTEQFINIEARLATLNKIKSKFEQILDSATEVADILMVQREIINTQTQIDNLVGRRRAIEDNVALTKITIYLSTDEIALPYTPDETFRPNVIFKLAVRSLVTSVRGIAEKLIWITVYSVIWIPALLIYLVVKRWKARRGKRQLGS